MQKLILFFVLSFLFFGCLTPSTSVAGQAIVLATQVRYSNSYNVASFNCVDYSKELVSLLDEKGITAQVFLYETTKQVVSFCNNSWCFDSPPATGVYVEQVSFASHAIVFIPSEDYYIEPQSAKLYKGLCSYFKSLSPNDEVYPRTIPSECAY